MYVSLRMAGADVSYERLLDRRYISRPDGSTVTDLVNAARDLGMSAVLIRNVRSDSLAAAKAPLILHVKQDATDLEYRHWLVYVGPTNDGRLLLYDAPRPIYAVTPAELDRNWDGIAIAVAEGPPDLTGLKTAGHRRLLLLIVSCVVLVAILHGIARRFAKYFAPPARRRRSLLAHCGLQSLAVVAGAMLIGLVTELVKAGSLLSNPVALAIAERAHFASSLPKLDAAAVAAALDERAVIFDARWRADFAKGHIPGAVCISPDANEAQRKRAVEAVPRERQVIVYCQSRSCTFSEELAKRLHDAGFSNVALFQGGWVEWEQWQAQQTPASTSQLK